MTSSDARLNRRAALGRIAALGAAAVLPRAFAAATPERLYRRIPVSGEQVPTIGMGTWRTFNVGTSESLIADRCEVLARLIEAGGTMVDSSPMYGSAEAVVGDCSARNAPPPDWFPVTKVWTSSADEGVKQIERSFALWRVETFALFQVHNLVGWRHHLPLLREMQQEGRIRYVGITTSHGRRHDELEDLMRSEPLDFVQLTYNLADRDAEERLLPIARDRGIAVIANRPFRRGALILRLAGHPLPAWAAEIGCDTVPQFLLKFIISHPDITCAIPATSRVDHMVENMQAMLAPLPDREMRGRMIEWLEAA